MIAYQILNKSGYPASNDLDDLCIFPSKVLAENFINYLDEQCGHLAKTFFIRKVKVTVLQTRKIKRVHA